MSVLFSYSKVEVEDFRGVDSRSEATNVVQPWGLVAKNVEYGPGLVKTRPGVYTKTEGALAGTPYSLVSWYHPPDGKTYLAWIDQSGMKVGPYNAGANTYSTGISTPVYGALAPWGDRIYGAPLGTGAIGGEGYQYITPSAATPAQQANRAPLGILQYAITFATSPVASGMSGGNRKYAVMFITQSGYVTRPGPLSTLGYTYGLSATAYPSQTNAANDSVTVTLTPTSTWPGDIVGAVLLITTTNNLARLLYAPVANAVITPGSSTPVSFAPIVAADGVLAQQPDALDMEQLLSRDGVGNPAFNPRGMFAAGDRMVYLLSHTNNAFLGGAGILISEPGSPETFSPDFHYRKLPSGQEPVAGFYYQGGIYIIGHNFTYVYTDTGDYPVTWPTPRLVSGSIGTSHIQGTNADPSGNCLVAHQSGLYLFQGGQYSTLPISYFQEAEWSSIQWPTPGVDVPFGVVEDRANQRIYVLCKSSTYGNCLLVWDYMEGISPDKVKFSVWTFPYEVSAMALVLNQGDSVSSLVRNHLWLAVGSGAPSGGQHFLLQKELGNVNLYDDNGVTIDSRYRGPYLPMNSNYLVNYHPGFEVRVLGSGLLTPRAYGYDDILVQVARQLTLSTAPGKAYTVLLDLRNEECSLEFRSGSDSGSAAGDYFQISGWDQYWTGQTKMR